MSSQEHGPSGIGRCPDCGTELTPIRQPRSGRSALWCWKCERYLRPGEQRAAIEDARD